MTLKEYVDQLNEIIKKNPAAANYEVVYSVDNKDYGFAPIDFPPIIGKLEDGGFLPEDEFEEGESPDSVCLT